MKRKIPLSHLIIGFIYNLVKFIPVMLIGAILLIIGMLGIKICTNISGIIIGMCIVFALVEETVIAQIQLQEHDNPEVNNFFDTAYGIKDNDEDASGEN